jgi:hypothetical protein
VFFNGGNLKTRKPGHCVPVFVFHPALQKQAFDACLKRKNHRCFRNGGFVVFMGSVEYIV